MNKGFNKKQHIRIAQDLYYLQEYVTDIKILFQKHYRKTPYRKNLFIYTSEIEKGVARLRSYLDTIYFKENMPDKLREKSCVYYPGGISRALMTGIPSIDAELGKLSPILIDHLNHIADLNKQIERHLANTDQKQP